MFARAHTFAVDAFDVRHVTVEVDVRSGLPAFAVVGLAGTGVREARERVLAAIRNSGLKVPAARITANLAPGDLPKAGSGFDLALACALLAASGQLPTALLGRVALFGELSLGGELRRADGSTAVALATRRERLEALILPRSGQKEAAALQGLVVAGAGSLRDVVALLRGTRRLPAPAPPVPYRPALATGPLLEDVSGMGQAIRALTVAAAGGHNLLFSGPPGSGKTMLARRLSPLLPPMTRQEALEVTRLHSVAGLHRDPGLVRQRPFRAPHHQTSAAGLIGGAGGRRPGEVALAHHGVLFLDELSEFARDALEALRQPLEDGEITVVRSRHMLRHPTRFMLVAATNPCVCGYAGTPRCRCTPGDLARYRRRLSGPLLDRIDLSVTVWPPRAAELRDGPLTTTASVRERVLAARERQARRLELEPVSLNAQLDARLLRRHARIDEDAHALLAAVHARGALTTRGHVRVLRVARTLADLDQSDRVTRRHARAALELRGAMTPTAHLAGARLPPGRSGASR